VATCIYAVHNAQCNTKETVIKTQSLDEQAWDRDRSARVAVKRREHKSRQRGKNQVHWPEQNMASACIHQNVIPSYIIIRCIMDLA